MRAWALALVLASLAPLPAAAQGAPLPDQKELLRLSELMGALHYLRPLSCAADGAVWRTKMSELMNAESGSPNLRELMPGALNHGYETFRESYRTCTPRARLVAGRYLDEGARLAEDISRHGGS